MRASVAAGLALGLVLSLTLAMSPAATAGCSSLLAQPTGCATAIYNSAKGNVQVKLAGAQAWGGAFPAYAAACPDLPVVGVVVPAVPGAGPVEAYAASVQAAAQAFRDGAAVDFFPAAAVFLGDAYFATVGVALTYSGQVDEMVLPLIPQTLPDSPDDLALPPFPDPSAGAGALQGWAGDQAAALQGSSEATAACLRGAPLP